MNEQDGTQSSTKQRRSRKTNTANQQNGKQAPAPQRPANDDTVAWKEYWKAQGQSWRTEPEIDLERQKYLTERRSITPVWQQGIFPFRDIKLSRADVEWLLATHENGRGPVYWSDESQRSREGLDLRGADLSQEDLRGLPLARMQGGLAISEMLPVPEEQRNMAVVRIQGANLGGAHLDSAILDGADLTGADLGDAHLGGAHLINANLTGAILLDADLTGAILLNANLSDANIRGASFDARTMLGGIVFSDGVAKSALVLDVRWDGVNLSGVNWEPVKKLGEEYEAKQPHKWYGQVKNKQDWLGGYQRAVQANRQLAVVLREQGLNEEADRFAYRAQLLQRKVLWREYKFGRWLFSLLLAILSGYGYRIWRILAAYLLTVSVFALAYFVLGMHYPPHLPLHQAFLESITALHGRVFFEQFSPDSPQIWLTALEAIAGLIIEGVFIAMLVQRFFGK